MEKKQRKQLVIQMLTAGIITFCLLWLLFYIKKYVPFGVHSLASKDADFQYLDFLAYLKDVFDGKNNIDYSFSKSIGGACIGVFSYYLSSPFNLLLLLFDKSQLVLFVHVIITLKLACAAATFAFYLNRRFEEWNDGSVKKQALIIFLAVSYAVSQYGIAQACNITWLDGFYMLPLIMLGVYRVVNGGRPVMLSVSVALAVLFNWYMGGINCVFACFWFLFEFAYSRLYSGDTKAEKTVIKDFAGKLGRFIYSMLAGVLISGVLFLPTIGAMRYSVRGSLDFGSLLDMSFIGDVSSVIDGYSVNEDRDYYKVVLHSKNKLDLDDGAEQFYVLDLDLLKSIAEELEKYTPDVMDIENGSAEFVVNAKQGQSLFTSIPYCDGWTVKVNGQKVQPDKVVDSLYSISLVEGENVVEMKFHVKYAGAGIACSIIGIAMLVFAEFYRKRRK